MHARVTLCHGNNGAQEFYEDEASTFVVWRFPSREDIPWQGFKMHGPGTLDLSVAAHGETAEHVIRRLHEQTGVAFAVDSSREWQQPRKGTQMVLVALV